MMNFDDPRQLGLLQFGLGALAASGPRPYRQTLGAGLAEAGQQGLKAYQGQQDRLEQKEMNKIRQDLLRAQIEETNAEAEQRRRLKELGISLNNKLPAAAQIGMILSDPNVSPEVKENIRFAVRADPTIAGIPYDPKNWSPRVPVSTVADVRRTLAQNEAIGTGTGRAQTQGLITAADEDAKADRDFSIETYDENLGRNVRKARSSLPGYPRTRIPQAQYPGGRMTPETVAAEGANNQRFIDENRPPPMPGSPVDAALPRPALASSEREKDAARSKRVQGFENAISKSELVLDTISKAKNNIGYTTTGIGGLTSVLPMTPARAFKGYLETIAANIGFGELQNMRFESETGAALGQIAVQELLSLQATIAKLDQLQSPTDVKDALSTVETRYKSGITKLRRAIAAEKRFLSTGRDVGEEDPLGLR